MPTRFILNILDHIRPHSLDIDLTFDHQDGKITVKTPSSQEVRLSFSNGKIFRQFLEMVGAQRSDRTQLEQMQQMLAKATISLYISIGDKEVIRITPNESPKLAYLNLIPQYLLYKLKL